MKKLLAGLLGVALAFTLVVGFAPVEKAEAAGEITLGYVNWACAEGKTYIAKAVLEQMGFEVDTMMADVAPIYSGVTRGDVDAFLASWLPVTHKSYVEQYQNDMVKVGVSYTGARIGLVVPEYMDIDCITELNDYADEFGNEIVGIDAGAGIMMATEDAIPAYDLDFNLVEGSDAAMTASILRAYRNEEPIVVTGWTPHWKFARWDLKFLDDPQGIYGDVEGVYAFARQDLGADYPEVVNFLHDFFVTDEQLGQVMEWIAEDDMDPAAAGQRWVEENQDVVEDWLNAVTSPF